MRGPGCAMLMMLGVLGLAPGALAEPRAEQPRGEQGAAATVPIPQQRGPVTVQLNQQGPAIVVGDFCLQPTVVLATDNRYDTVNTRERAARQDDDQREANRRGEQVEWKLGKVMRPRPKVAPRDAGFQVATEVREALAMPVSVEQLPVEQAPVQFDPPRCQRSAKKIPRAGCQVSGRTERADRPPRHARHQIRLTP